MSDTATAPAPDLPPANHPEQGMSVPRRRASGFVPFGGTARRQELLGRYYPALWQEVEARWLPTARAISLPDVHNTGDYQRAHLADVILKLPEWDGYSICAALELLYGWHPDAALVAIIHRWSCGLISQINLDKKKERSA